MRRITKLEENNFDLNEKLNASDKEYIQLFKDNMRLSDKIADLKVLKLIEKIKL